MTHRHTPHIPILLKESVEALGIKHDGAQQTVVDCTFGAGGHTNEILTKYPKVKVIAIDRDESASRFAKQIQEEFGSRFSFSNDLFSNIGNIISEKCPDQVNGILYDLGFSSMQIDSPSRGFSIQAEGKLSMQMGINKISAFDVVNCYPEDHLADILFHYGNERYARRIARAIANKRLTKSIETTTELEAIIYSALPMAAKGHGKIHPATKSFQAIRIEVNNELQEINTSLQSALLRLATGGKLCAISFHSLEDRVIKEFIRKANGADKETFDRSDPSTWGQQDQPQAMLAEIDKILPTTEEIRNNPRARSAKLRVIEKILPNAYSAKTRTEPQANPGQAGMHES